MGPGAHAFDGRPRRWNAARLDTYIAALTPVGRGDPPGCRRVARRPWTSRPPTAEALILGLRTDAGVASAAVVGQDRLEAFAWAAELELVTVDPDDRIRLTTRGRLLSNELFSRLL